MEGFLFDPHTHTAETSKCGHLPAAEVVDRYVRSGFSGLVVTDHLHPEYLSRIDKDHDWNKAMDHYLSGYHASKKRGDEVGFQVILGTELRFPENDNDYLVYGIDEDWLRSNPLRVLHERPGVLPEVPRPGAHHPRPPLPGRQHRGV